MKQRKAIMGMPISVEILDKNVTTEIFEKVFDYFVSVDNRFSPFKKDSEVTLINERKITPQDYSQEMKEVLKLSEQTRKETDGYFDIHINGKINPSGLVKGWAIFNAAKLLRKMGFQNYYVDAGGDIQIEGQKSKVKSQKWRVGIKNPFNQREIIKVMELENCGVATSGTYLRGQHIYNPQKLNEKITDIVSLTVIGPNVYEADRFATPAFAMGKKGIEFIEKLSGFEGYMIDKDGIATMTSGFEKYTIEL